MKTNKGFSLVELIIVIAIMAILLGVLAPQYIKYVERSRLSADEDIAQSLLDSAHVLISDEEHIDDVADGDTITFSSAGIVGSSTGVTSALLEYYSDDLPAKKPKSRSYKNLSYVITFSQKSNGDFVLEWGWQ